MQRADSLTSEKDNTKEVEYIKKVLKIIYMTVTHTMTKLLHGSVKFCTGSQQLVCSAVAGLVFHPQQEQSHLIPEVGEMLVPLELTFQPTLAAHESNELLFPV